MTITLKNKKQEIAVLGLLEHINVEAPDIVLLAKCINRIRATAGIKKVDYTIKKKSILEEAIKLTSKDRREMYGDPTEKFTDIAKIFTTLTGKKIKPEEIVLMLIITKLSRETTVPKKDNRVDIAGYIGIYDEVIENGFK